jgi:hypothetical protein
VKEKKQEHLDRDFSNLYISLTAANSRGCVVSRDNSKEASNEKFTSSDQRNLFTVQFPSPDCWYRITHGSS